MDELGLDPGIFQEPCTIDSLIKRDSPSNAYSDTRDIGYTTFGTDDFLNEPCLLSTNTSELLLPENLLIWDPDPRPISNLTQTLPLVGFDDTYNVDMLDTLEFQLPRTGITLNPSFTRSISLSTSPDSSYIPKETSQATRSAIDYSVIPALDAPQAFQPNDLAFFSVPPPPAAIDITSSTPTWYCPVCARAFLKRHLLVVHQLRHVKPFHCPLEGCGSAHGAKKDLNRHLWCHHTNYATTHNVPDKPEACPKCGKIFRKDNMARHMRSKHKSGSKTERKLCRKR
jgi:hypothetical protein